MTHPGGRPPFYETVEAMQEEIDKYFADTSDEEITVTGLALALGFTSRAALLNYQEKEEFVNTVKKAKTKVENSYERSLRKNGRSGDIFALKNFGWDDKQSLNIAGQEGGAPIATSLTIEFIKPT